MFAKLAAWLRMDDYHARRAASAQRVVRRFSRGNIAMQRGKYITAAELERRSQAAIVTMDNIERDLLHR